MDGPTSSIRSARRSSRRYEPTSTVGRGKSVVLSREPRTQIYQDESVCLRLGDSLEHYHSWPSPTVIVSDGAYGVLGFEGDISDHLDLPLWYETHIAQWSRYACAQTTLWFWNSEIGWAAVHPVLEKHGWRYQNCNIWNKGLGHIAGNVHTKKIRRFPVVSEVCVQYVFEARIGGKVLKEWLLHEWKRSGLPLRRANEACGVRDAAVRKYLDQGHLWYFPPPERFVQLQEYANRYGDPRGKPYFCIERGKPGTAEEWACMRSKFRCPHGITNIWDRSPVNGPERIKAPSGKAVHLNQKPVDLMVRTIEAASDPGDIIWEPFGGLFTGALAAKLIQRKAYGCETDPTYFQYGVERFKDRLLFPLHGLCADAS